MDWDRVEGNWKQAKGKVKDEETAAIGRITQALGAA